MSNICRLCGNNEDQTIFIFGNEAMKHHIDLKIRVGLDIQIFPDDPLPKHACVCCLGKLDEFCTFQHHCRRVQTNLRRLLPERVPFQVQNRNCDLHQNPKTSTEESSAHIEVFETLVDSTANDVNDPFDLNSSNNGKVEVGKIKVEAHSHENSNNSVHIFNESRGNECDPSSNDPYLINSGLLIATENGTSQAACQLHSYCQDRDKAMAFSTDGFTSESAPEHKYVTVEGVSEVQEDLASKMADLRNTPLGRFDMLFVDNDYVTSNSFSDTPEDSLLMEEEVLQVSNNVQATASMLTFAQKGSEDKGFDTFSVNNNLNQNSLQGQNMISESSHYLTIANKGHHGNENTDTGAFQVNNAQSSLLMEEHFSKNRYHGTDGTQILSRVIVNNINNNKKQVHCDSAFNTLRHPLLKGKVACKTTSPATVTCFQNLSVQEVYDAEITQENGSDSSQQSGIITELPINHPNHVGNEATNVSSGIGTSHNETSSDDNPRYLLGKAYNTSPQVTGKLMRNTVFDLNGHFINTDSRPLQVIPSDRDFADISDQNMETSGKVSEVIDLVDVTNENEVHQALQLDTASRSDWNMNRENKGHSEIVNSGNCAICVHGIDASKCIFQKCCDSHPVDKYWNRVESRFRCLLCEVSVRDKYIVRAHICKHLSLKLFECSICDKKFRLFQKLCFHIKSHGLNDDMSYVMARGRYSCESCSKTFKYKCHLHKHQNCTHVVTQNLQIKSALLSDSNINCESKEQSVIDNTKIISSVIVNNINKKKMEVHCDSAFNTLRHPLLKGKVACKTTSPATDTCFQNISVQEVHDADITEGNCSDSSQQSVIITELPMNHPNHVRSGATNVSSGIRTSHNETSSDDNPRYLLGRVYNTSPQISGKLMRNTIFDSNGHFINTDSRPLQVMHSDGDFADISDQNMETSGKVSEVIDLVADTIETEVRRALQLNTALCSDSNINRESTGRSVIVNSGNSATCAHGIDASQCLFIRCCDSHLVDKYWNMEGSRFRCLLCEFSVRDKYNVRTHICKHLSLKVFECFICYKKFRVFGKLCEHIKSHGQNDGIVYLMPGGAYSCESCSKTFKFRSSLHKHRIRNHVVPQNLQINTALLSESEINYEIKELSVIVNSGNSATCVHGIDTTMCFFKKCCSSHPFDKYWNKRGSRFHCLLCDCVSDCTYKIREHISGHLSLKLFQCPICDKKFRSFQKLYPHIKTHGKIADRNS